MKVKSVVIDTNVLISSALSTKGVPATCVRYFILHSKIIFSDETFEEFYSRLWRPKFDRYISREKQKSILLDFSIIEEWVEIDEVLVPTVSVVIHIWTLLRPVTQSATKCVPTQSVGTSALQRERAICVNTSVTACSRA